MHIRIAKMILNTCVLNIQYISLITGLKAQPPSVQTYAHMHICTHSPAKEDYFSEGVENCEHNVQGGLTDQTLVIQVTSSPNTVADSTHTLMITYTTVHT